VIVTEAVPDPDLPIVDAHHHLSPKNHWGGGGPYLLREFSADLNSGHRIVSTMYVECGVFYRPSGPSHLQPAGEAAFAAATARQAEVEGEVPTRVCEGFIGHADLLSGDVLEESLNALRDASEGRLRGVRYSATWDPDPQLSAGARGFAPKGIMADPRFREGLRKVAAANLVYDAWQFYPQLGELGALADDIADARIVCGHAGGLIGKRAYAGADNFHHWKRHVTELSRHPNVYMKIGGLAHERTGFNFRNRSARPTQQQLVELWRPYIETCIEEFGAARCMFESNFPVDRESCGYGTLWNAFKRVTRSFSPDEKSHLFSGTANAFYRLGLA